MTYTDAQGRPEIVMHPDIVRGAAGYRIVGEIADDADPTADQPIQDPDVPDLGSPASRHAPSGAAAAGGGAARTGAS